jgi:hypothetical protein
MTHEKAQQERDHIKACLSNQYLGSAQQRLIWRRRAAALNKGLKQLTPNSHAKNNSNSRAPHR